MSGVVAAVACSLGLWSYSGPAAPAVPIVAAECSCRCDHTCAVSGEAGADRAVLDLLKNQLDRCGPDQLKAQPCVCPPQAPCPPILQRGALELLGVGFCFGLLVGASVAWPLRARVCSPSVAPQVPTSYVQQTEREEEREERFEAYPLALPPYLPDIRERRLRGKQAQPTVPATVTYIPKSRR